MARPAHRLHPTCADIADMLVQARLGHAGGVQSSVRSVGRRCRETAPQLEPRDAFGCVGSAPVVFGSVDSF
eukprot:15479534-Alexandrium_andersonii.AAC.1